MPRQSECTTLVLDPEKIRVWMQAALIKSGEAQERGIVGEISRTILPVASTMQTQVSLTDTSSPAKWIDYWEKAGACMI